MARKQSAIVNWSQYLALRGVAGVIQSLDPTANLYTAAAIGSLFHQCFPKRAARAERNIALSFPDWSEEQVMETADKSMQYMFQLFMVEALYGPRMINPDTWPKHIRLHRIDRVLDLLTRNQAAILITGHCGNWELLGFGLSAMGFPITAVARPLDNPLINDWLLGIRAARGMQIITKWGATQALIDHLRHGGRVGFIADQNAGDQGLFVPFFGRLASSYKSIGLLAMRYKTPIITGYARRQGMKLDYELASPDIIFPDDWVDQPDPLFYITARFNRAIELMVRDDPAQYLWIHRRWKSRPRFEQEGRPMPGRLIAKIESLPWMTQQERDRIVSLSEEGSAESRKSAGVKDG